MKGWPVVEIFGPTLQGEGALAGTRSHFVRFAFCDFKCVWCDSAHAVVPRRIKATRLEAWDLRDRVVALGRSDTCEWVTLSGGNPCLYDLEPLVALLHKADYKVAVETQGTLAPTWLRDVDLITLSPKPPSAQQPEVDIAHFLDAIEGHRGPRNVVLKVVVFDDADLAYARGVHLTFGEIPFYLSVGTQMGGLTGKYAGGAIDTADTLTARYRWLVEASLGDAVFKDARILPQLHTLIWGHERGH